MNIKLKFLSLAYPIGSMDLGPRFQRTGRIMTISFLLFLLYLLSIHLLVLLPRPNFYFFYSSHLLLYIFIFLPFSILFYSFDLFTSLIDPRNVILYPSPHYVMLTTILFVETVRNSIVYGLLI